MLIRAIRYLVKWRWLSIESSCFPSVLWVPSSFAWVRRCHDLMRFVMIHFKLYYGALLVLMLTVKSLCIRDAWMNFRRTLLGILARTCPRCNPLPKTGILLRFELLIYFTSLIVRWMISVAKHALDMLISFVTQARFRGMVSHTLDTSRIIESEVLGVAVTLAFRTLNWLTFLARKLNLYLKVHKKSML